MPRTQLSIATLNLLNLNEPGEPIYNDEDGWSPQQFSQKLEWTSRMLADMRSDVWGFQELWHKDSLQACFTHAGLAGDYTLLTPPNQTGQRIICAGAVRSSILVGEPEWIDEFPEHYKLASGGDDPQTSNISVNIDKFSRPVLYYQVKPRTDGRIIHVYVCHFKSKRPTDIHREDWYRSNIHGPHRKGLGAAISTIRRTAEAAALRMILTERMKGTNDPVIVMGDFNDGQHSNTLNIVTEQPNFLVSGLSQGGADNGLYTVGTLQEYRSLRDIYYTHIFKNLRESLDHILVSQEFYDNSKKRIWAFKGMDLANDHLNDHNHKETGTSDHGVVRAQFEYHPTEEAKRLMAEDAAAGLLAEPG